MGNRKPIFGSNSEKQVFRTLKGRWAKVFDVYPQIPVRRVCGYDALMTLPVPQRQREYLLRTEFDFVVTEKDTGIPFLAIEFDGLGHGFSKDGEYISRVTALRDPYRKLKIEAKLNACNLLEVPLIVVSWEELEDFDNASDSFNVLDGIIGALLAKQKFEERVAKSVFRDDDHAMDVEIDTELEFNPIVKKVARMLPLVSSAEYSEGSEPLYDREQQGYVGERNYLFKFLEPGHSTYETVSVSVYIRDINCFGMSVYGLLHDLGRYFLYKKAIREFGLGRARR